MRHQVGIVGIVALCASACTPGGQTGEEPSICQIDSINEVEFTEQTELGFSAQELVSEAGDPHPLSIVYASGDEAEGSLGATYAGGTARVLHQSWGSGSGGLESSLDTCQNVLEVAIQLNFTTSDGKFLETVPATLVAADLNSIDTSVELNINQLQGSYTITELDPSDYDSIAMFLESNISNRQGELWLQAAKDGDGSGDDGVVSVERFDIASWSTAP